MEQLVVVRGQIWKPSVVTHFLTVTLQESDGSNFISQKKLTLYWMF